MTATLRARKVPRCEDQFEREEGYYLGDHGLNLIVAEILGLGLAIFLSRGLCGSQWTLCSTRLGA